MFVSIRSPRKIGAPLRQITSFPKAMERLVSLLLLLYLLHSGICDDQVWILKYNREIDCESSDVGVPIKANSVIKEFTFCGKYSFKFLRESTLMSLGGTDIYFEIYDFEAKKVGLHYNNGYYFFDYHNQTLIPNEWYHICLAVSMDQMKVVLNGEILSNEELKFVAKEGEITSTLWFGIQKHSKFVQAKRLEGAITDAHLWNESLKINHLTLITSNGTMTDLPPPDLFAWPPNDQKSNKPCYEYLSVAKHDELLQNDPPKKVLLVEDYENFNLSNYLCQAYGGKLFVPKNDEDWSKLTALFKKSGNCSFSYLGIKKSNDDMIIDLNGENVSFLNWGINQPNGKSWQQCIAASFNGKELKHDDLNCENEFCFSCQIQTKNTFKLRGNIPNGAEREYSLREYFVGLEMMSKDINITGFKETDCFWNGTWHFGKHLKLENSTSNMPPVGAKKWNDDKLLKFTQCNNDEFTCHSYGHCISMTKRCDGHPDCAEDGSDENECEMITFSKGYNNLYSQEKNGINVSISMDVHDIEEINELEMNIMVTVEVTLKWLDSRLTFRNLEYNDFFNQLNNEEINKIWTPSLLFKHSKGTYIKAGGDGTVWVKRNGSKQLNQLSELDEDYLYSGNENPIIMVSKVHVKLDCAFDLTMYPFDTQRCQIKLKRPNAFYDQFVMNWDEAPITRHIELNEYDNLDELGYDDTNTSMTIVEVEIILCRKLSYQIVNIFIPTLCIMMISVFTLYIDFSHFEATIMVALTSMLVMHTLYQGTSHYLPHTSYMKMIDIWLFGGLILPFLSITVLIMMDYLVNNEISQVIEMTKEKKVRLNSKLFIKTMQISTPIISGTFSIIYWIIGLYHHYNDCKV